MVRFIQIVERKKEMKSNMKTFLEVVFEVIVCAVLVIGMVTILHKFRNRRRGSKCIRQR